MNIETIISSYLDSKALAWEPTTLRSERYRLAAVASHLDGKATTLWAALKDAAPYSRLTTWTRVAHMWQWAADKNLVSGNDYRIFREENARLFKNVYERTKPTIGFQEASDRINRIAIGASRERALQMLQSGMRFNESGTFSEGSVRGKGGKRRRAYLPDDAGRVDSSVRYSAFRRHLAAVGLKPHDLRKLFLSRLVECGINEHDLREVAGWASIQTATSYIQANSSKIADFVKASIGGTSNVTGVKVP